MRKELLIYPEEPNPINIMSDEMFNRILFQRTLDGIYNEIAIPVMGCKCKRCGSARLASNLILQLAEGLKIKGLYYETHKRKNHTKRKF